MIATEKFVYIHMPKTGGTFVEEVVRKIHVARGDTIKSKKIRDGQMLRQAIRLLKPSQNFTVYSNPTRAGSGYTCHGICRQIPLAHRKKPVLTSVRNPYDWHSYTWRIRQYASRL